MLSSTQGPMMSTSSATQHQQMGLTPQQKQEKLNLIRANSLQSNGGKFIKNQLSLMQKKQADEINSNNESSANDIMLMANGEWKNPDHISINGGLKRDISPAAQ